MKSISAAAIVLSLVIGPLTSAHADHDRHDHKSHAEKHHVAHHGDRDHDRKHERRDHDHDYGKRDAYRDGYRHGRYDAGRYLRPQGYYQHAWRRGDRLPKAYFANRYVVRNYGAYRLHAPPRGHHWVRVDRDVVLTAIATGAVIAVVNDLFH